MFVYQRIQIIVETQTVEAVVSYLRRFTMAKSYWKNFFILSCELWGCTAGFFDINSKIDSTADATSAIAKIFKVARFLDSGSDGASNGSYAKEVLWIRPTVFHDFAPRIETIQGQGVNSEYPFIQIDKDSSDLQSACVSNSFGGLHI